MKIHRCCETPAVFVGVTETPPIVMLWEGEDILIGYVARASRGSEFPIVLRPPRKSKKKRKK